MKTTTALTTALTLSATALFADGHAGTTGYALANDGTTLLTMADIAAPEATSLTLDSTIDGLAYRPVTGDLMGFSKSGAVYVIDTATGALTDTGASFADDITMADDSAVAFDFNNVLDAVRAVGSDGVNVVYFPSDFGDDKANTAKRFTDAFYVDGDANAGTTPMIFANAYTNAIAGAKAGGTAQYAIDAETNALVTLANNAGELATVAPITINGAEVDLTAEGGMDIVSLSEGQNAAYAILTVAGGNSGLYAIDLETGVATGLADLGMAGVTGFAAVGG